MAELSFLDKLTPEQLAYAVKVAQAAKEAGVPPKLAVAIAYQESGLNPKSVDGKDGEIGGMQIKPDTAKSVGFSLGDIKTEQGNINAGIAYLKLSLDKTKQNPMLAAYGYNAGVDHPVFYGGEGSPKAKSYMETIGKYGAYEGLMPSDASKTNLAPTDQKIQVDETAEPPLSSAPALEDAPPPKPIEPDTSGASPGERFVAGAAGTAVGTAATTGKGLLAAKDARSVRLAQLTAAAAEKGRMAAQAAAGTTAAGSTGVAGSAATGSTAAGTTQSGAAGARPASPGSVIADAGYLGKGETGRQVYNTAKGLGFTDIEAAEFVKQGATADDVYATAKDTRSAGFKKIRSSFPTDRYLENPQYGGLLTTDQGGGKGPKQSFKVQGALPTADLPPNYMPGPAAPPPQGSLVEIPKPTPSAPPSLAQRTAAGLDEVANLFKSMMKPVAATARYAGKYALPPLAGLSAGLDVAEMAHEYDKAADQRDYIKMGTKGAGVVGGALSMFPPTAPVGVPLMLGAGALDLYRDPEARAYAEKKMQEMQQGVKRRFDQVPSGYSDPMGYAQ